MIGSGIGIVYWFLEPPNSEGDVTRIPRIPEPIVLVWLITVLPAGAQQTQGGGG